MIEQAISNYYRIDFALARAVYCSQKFLMITSQHEINTINRQRKLRISPCWFDSKNPPAHEMHALIAVHFVKAPIYLGDTR